MEGIRPELNAKELRYQLVDGPLLEFADEARKAEKADPETPFVLVVDEINRANLSRVFGELLFLLEYRKEDASAPLLYSRRQLRLPRNLYLICTMNSADRSIALVDFALRRRFHFIEFRPDINVLRRWLAINCPTPAAELVPDYLAKVNELFGSSDFAVGFSYFMRKDLDEAVTDRIWQHDIMPTVEEFHANDRAKIKQFELEAIRRALAGPGKAAVPPAAPEVAGAAQ